MNNIFCKIKSALAAIVIIFFSQTCLYAQSQDLDTLFARLLIVEPADAPELETKILLEWSKSGSPAMEILLNRGRIALLNEDYDTALKHFNALTDHAPNFVEGWSLSAVALQKWEKRGQLSMELNERWLLNRDTSMRFLVSPLFWKMRVCFLKLMKLLI